MLAGWSEFHTFKRFARENKQAAGKIVKRIFLENDPK